MREFELDELATYGYCPLKWRYRYEWKLTYIEADSQEAYFFSVRKALARYANGYISETKKHLAAGTRNTFRQFLAQFESLGVFDFGEAGQMYTDGWNAIADFHRKVSGKGFVPAKATDIPCFTYIEDAKINGCLDIVLDPPDKYPNDVVALCHITNEKSSLYSPRFMPVKYGWSIAVLRQQLGPKTKIMHSTFSPWSPKPISLAKNSYLRTSFTGTVRGLIKGVESRAAWQIPHRDRCAKCCYNLICDPGHSRDLKPSEIKVLDERMQEWTSRRAASAARQEARAKAAE
jgi:hypothetical protein